MRLLVVDDDLNMARTLSDILALKGFGVERAHSATEALALVRQGRERLDCLISDIKMAGMNGVELYRALLAERPGLPAVLMTAYSSDRLVREAMAAGALAVLDKPVDIERLLGLLGQVAGV